jgi:TPR repeat protein
MYRHGQGTPKNLPKAFELCEKAAIGGRAISMFNLGHFYEMGIGVKKNLDKAVEWFSQAADKKDADAVGRIVDIYIAQGKYDKALQTIVDYQGKGMELQELQDKTIKSIAHSDTLANMYIQLYQQHKTLCDDYEKSQKIVQHLQVCPAETYKEAMADFELASKNGII